MSHRGRARLVLALSASLIVMTSACAGGQGDRAIPP